MVVKVGSAGSPTNGLGERGAYQNKLEMARAMLGIGLSVEQIQLCTGLPLETVERLRRE